MAKGFSGGGSTTPAIALLTIGGILLVSGFKNQPLAAVFSGSGETEDGGSVPNVDAASGPLPPGVPGSPYAGPPSPATGAALGTLNKTLSTLGSGAAVRWPAMGAKGFRGPHATLLNRLAEIGQNQYHLTVTATTNGGHVPGSYHYSGRAFDISGTEANMHAFAQYCMGVSHDLKELIHNPGFGVKDGNVVNGAQVFSAVWEGHKDHVHVAA